MTSPDYARVFTAMPTPYLVLSSELTIRDANPAYLAMAGRQREQLVGRPMAQALPDPPALRESLERARDTCRPDSLPLQRYDAPTGERYWSLVSVPVLDDSGACVLLLQRAEDVTDYVRGRARRKSDSPEDTWRRDTQAAEAALFARDQELQAARDSEAVAAARKAALADVALELAAAQTVDEVTVVVVERGLSALGAHGGAIGLTAEDGSRLSLTITDSSGPSTQRRYTELPLDSPLPSCVSARTGQTVLLSGLTALPAETPDLADVLSLTGWQAGAAVPLMAADRRLGSLLAGWWQEPPQFSLQEVDLIAGLAAQCAQALERIFAQQAERETHQQVRRLAESLQRSLLSEPPPQEHLQITVRYLPAARHAQIGGDWYDAFTLADGTLTVVIGDVAGHDRNAAAAMAQLRNVLRGIAHTLGEPPAVVLASLDGAMRELNVDELATAVLAQVEVRPPEGPPDGPDEQLRTLRWSNAGHPPPLLIEPDGTVSLLSTPPDLLLGLDPETPRVDHERVLRPGSTLLLYTDGMIERRGTSLDVGLEWLRSTATSLAQLPLDQLCDGLLDRLLAGLDDDIALLGLRLLPPEAAAG